MKPLLRPADLGQKRAFGCDRGQRYRSPECRSEGRRQRHDASCRYQQSGLRGVPIRVVSSAIASGRCSLP
jgi:hypothetical protein